ncbi:uncharacterized protein LAESUDRAFT_553590 [Laetiporus sulphureus 93-53]|uniref:Uncharacterized protein n=1 Tax=Laetiporus sulphureus 93-53 TaxID=1314785 RepID=A0A165B825_9APHY|nr:uncharacterized protein LAESUDRAFT_553590 [Laetiporus sulphureus 93-53]KZT00459.1 hypothetical protein LAESUDRAFT_553590 [Laetiporus sulphureus 93-53]
MINARLCCVLLAHGRIGRYGEGARRWARELTGTYPMGECLICLFCTVFSTHMASPPVLGGDTSSPANHCLVSFKRVPSFTDFTCIESSRFILQVLSLRRTHVMLTHACVT